MRLSHVVYSCLLLRHPRHPDQQPWALWAGILRSRAAYLGDRLTESTRRLPGQSLAAAVYGIRVAGFYLVPHRCPHRVALYAQLAAAISLPGRHFLVDLCRGGI